MNIIFGIILAYLVLPIIGEIFVYTTGINLYAGSVDKDLIFYNIIHVSIILAFVFKVINTRGVSINIQLNKPNRVIIRCLIISIIGFLLIFMISGYKFLILGINRSDIRVSLGAIGIPYMWLVRFLMPAILALSTLAYLTKDRPSNLSTRALFFLTWLMVILSSISTGYKATVISMLLPALSLIFFHNKVLGLGIKLTPLIIATLSLTTAMVRNISVTEGFYFLIHRMTVMVAYGTIGVWNEFPNGVSLSESMKLSYNIFGNNIAQVLLGHSRHSIEFLSTNLSRLITYLAYPNAAAALSEHENVTVTNFGEAYYIFGKWFAIYSIFSGIIIYLFVRSFKKSLRQNKSTSAIVLLTYICAVILPWLNSSSIFILISLPTVIWLSLTIIVLYLIQFSKSIVN